MSMMGMAWVDGLPSVYNTFCFPLDPLRLVPVEYLER